MDKLPDSVPLQTIEPHELARLEAERRAKSVARDEEREALSRVWREQQDYARAREAHRPAPPPARRAPQIVVALLIAAGIVAAVIYSVLEQQKSEDEALRLAAELLARQEDQERARLAAPVSAPALTPAAPAPAAKEPPIVDAAEKAAAERARVLALRIREEARRKVELETKKQAEAMTQAEERAKAVSAAAVKEPVRTVQRPGSVFQDCPECPRMVVVAAGEFLMGSPAGEAGRGLDEGPQRQVAIAQPFALGRSEVTVGEFRRFVEETGYKTEAERDTRAQGCSGFIYTSPQSFTTWRSPGLTQADSHPALCVSWNDARAYTQWLSKKTGRRYRLPSEAEWEYAARAGAGSSRYWGEDPVQACRFANVADQSRFQTLGFGQKHECTDGHYFTAPAGGYAPNLFGLYDMIGNVWEWTDDCWNASYAGAPADGAAWLRGDCSQRVVRGGSWSTAPRFARSATRYKNPADFRDNLTGFRVARTLE